MQKVEIAASYPLGSKQEQEHKLNHNFPLSNKYIFTDEITMKSVF